MSYWKWTLQSLRNRYISWVQRLVDVWHLSFTPQWNILLQLTVGRQGRILTPRSHIIIIGSSGVVVGSTGVYERLSVKVKRLSHQPGPVLGWVARVECPVPKHYTCQAVQSGFWESFSWPSIVLRMTRKIEVLPTWCAMLGGVKDPPSG